MSISSNQNIPKGSAYSNLNPVCACTSSNVVSFAISVKTNLPSLFSKTANYVITIETTPLAVNGNLQFSSNLTDTLPSFVLAECSIRTMTLEPQATRSIAPPMPFIILPGMIQLAMSQLCEIYSAPSMVISRCPPRMMEKDCDEEKYDPPGRMVMVY